MAVLLLPWLVLATLPSPVTVLVLLLPAVARAMLLSPRTVARLPSPPPRLGLPGSTPAMAKLPSPWAIAVLLLPPDAVAVPPLVAVAVHRLHLVASAVLPAPRATARECSPGVVIATVVSLGSVSRTVTPLTDLA